MKTNMPIFVVNLQHDHDKKIHMEKILDSLDLKFEFIAAVYGKDLTQLQVDEVYDECLSQAVFGRGLSLGELGCALSHLSIYQKMVNEGIETALILEDDVDISDDIHDIFKSTEQFPKNWELMLCGYYSETATEKASLSSFWEKRYVTSSHQSVRLVEIAYGTHGYIINHRGAKRLLKTLKTITKPIDHYTGSEHYLNMYALTPRIISLNEVFKLMGCIEFEREKKSAHLKDYSSLKVVIRHVLYCLRKVKVIYWLKEFPSRLIPLKKYN